MNESAHSHRQNSAEEPPRFRWIDIAFGARRGSPTREARGFLAIGQRAFGVIAIGGIARGLITLGGISIGVLSFGGISVGGWALGGLALGGFAVGGAAAGYVAQGGGAVGRYACGGAAWGTHALSPASFFDQPPTPQSLTFFATYGNPGCRAMVANYATVKEARQHASPERLADELQRMREAQAEARLLHEQSMKAGREQLDAALKEADAAIAAAREQQRLRQDASKPNAPIDPPHPP